MDPEIEVLHEQIQDGQEQDKRDQILDSRAHAASLSRARGCATSVRAGETAECVAEARAQALSGRGSAGFGCKATKDCGSAENLIGSSP